MRKITLPSSTKVPYPTTHFNHISGLTYFTRTGKQRMCDGEAYNTAGTGVRLHFIVPSESQIDLNHQGKKSSREEEDASVAASEMLMRKMLAKSA